MRREFYKWVCKYHSMLRRGVNKLWFNKANDLKNKLTFFLMYRFGLCDDGAYLVWPIHPFLPNVA